VTTTADQEQAPTERQQAVLDAVLDLLVEGGDQITMTAVAKRASCSKETLYKWYGDRDGLLAATVRWQASKVRAGNYDRQKLDAEALRDSLEAFAANWLKVISSRTSIALNRVAVSHAGSGKSNLGALVLANGRFAIGERLKPLLEAGRAADLRRR
jgi:AcrR family transcriptional regulator